MWLFIGWDLVGVVVQQLRLFKLKHLQVDCLVRICYRFICTGPLILLFLINLTCRNTFRLKVYFTTLWLHANFIHWRFGNVFYLKSCWVHFLFYWVALFANCWIRKPTDILVVIGRMVEKVLLHSHRRRLLILNSYRMLILQVNLWFHLLFTIILNHGFEPFLRAWVWKVIQTDLLTNLYFTLIMNLFMLTSLLFRTIIGCILLLSIGLLYTVT